MLQKKSLLKNEDGVVAIQFLFVLIISMFFLLSFFGLCLTLTVGSSVQYLTYSTSRALLLADENPSTQQERARIKYQELRAQFFKDKFNSDTEWFNIPNQVETGFNSSYDESGNFRNMFYGAYINFKSTLTNFKIPLLTDADDGELNTTVGSYLGREPSQTECEQFSAKRQGELCGMYGFPCAGNTPTDNGC